MTELERMTEFENMPLRDRYANLLGRLQQAESSLLKLKQTDAEFKENLIGYYKTIIRWIDIARNDGSMQSEDICLLNIKESLQGAINEWALPVGTRAETNPSVG